MRRAVPTQPNKNYAAKAAALRAMRSGRFREAAAIEKTFEGFTDEVRDVRLQRRGKPRRRRHVADRLRSVGVDRRRRGKDRRAGEESGELRIELDTRPGPRRDPCRIQEKCERKLSGTYSPTKWDEKPYDLIEDRMKATKATVEFSFAGDIEGAAGVEYLMFYRSFDPTDPHEAIATYVGMIRIVGKLRGKSGSFALTDSGKYEFGAAQSQLSVIPGSGTGELSKISGSGSYRADTSGCTWELDVSL
jgi:hypothetical protein